jgi:CheY-like chemotaxis protein
MTTARHILVVEDNDPARRQFANALGREGYEVVALRDGRKALDYLATNPPPDLILLDMLMPVLDGWHFLERLPQPHAPVVIATSTILTPDWAESHGCAGFLRKPIEADELLAEVRRCLA